MIGALIMDLSQKNKPTEQEKYLFQNKDYQTFPE